MEVSTLKVASKVQVISGASQESAPLLSPVLRLASQGTSNITQSALKSGENAFN